MHTTQIGYGTNWQVKGPDGRVIWEGQYIIGQAFMVSNALAANQAGWYPGTPIIQTSTSTIGAAYRLSSTDAVDLVLAGVIVASTSSVGFLGVGLTVVAATPATIPPFYPYPAGLVASVGSICPVNMVSSAGAVGDVVGGSATAGLGGVIAAAGATAVVNGKGLGVIIKATADNGATSGVDGAGGAGRYTAGVLISPQ